jgi:hypothetical protein
LRQSPNEPNSSDNAATEVTDSVALGTNEPHSLNAESANSVAALNGFVSPAASDNELNKRTQSDAPREEIAPRRREGNEAQLVMDRIDANETT